MSLKSRRVTKFRSSVSDLLFRVKLCLLLRRPYLRLVVIGSSSLSRRCSFVCIRSKRAYLSCYIDIEKRGRLEPVELVRLAVLELRLVEVCSH